MSAKSNAIRTSRGDWSVRLARAYHAGESATVIDDAGLGIDPADESLMDMIRRDGRLAARDWAALAAAVGMTGAGMWLFRLAAVDPEPTSKLALILIGGTVLVVGGAALACDTLLRKRPAVRYRKGDDAFELRWD